MLNSATLETGDFVVIDDVLNARRQRPHPVTGSMFQPVTTSDGQPVTHGLAVFDYDWRHGYIDLSEVARRGYSDGWFQVCRERSHVGSHAWEDRGSLMNGERTRTRHWGTGEAA